MSTELIVPESGLQRVLWACYQLWKSESLPPEERVICHKWVSGVYREQFGGEFHQSQLRQLADLGFLVREDTSRGGHRRYYRLVDPTRLAECLHEWDLACT